MDIGPDSAYALFGEWRPFTSEEIYDRLIVREGHDPVEFYKEYQKQLEKERTKSQVSKSQVSK